MVNFLYDGRSNNWLQFLSTLPNNSAKWPRLKENVSTLRRQSETVQLIIQAYKNKRPGLIIADDVGLGKTWIGILAAIAWASNGDKVLIVTPNQTLKKIWEDELRAWLLDPNPALRTRKKPGKFIKHHPGQFVFIKDINKRKIEITTSHKFNKGEWSESEPALLIVDEAHRGQSDGSTIDQICTQAPKAFRLLLTATPFGKNIDTLKKLLGAAGCTNADQGLIDSVGEANGMLLNPETMDLKAFEDTIRKLRRWMIRHTIDTLPLSERRSLGEPKHILGSLIAPSAADTDNRREIITDPIVINNPDFKQLMLHAERLRQLCPNKLGGAETLVAPYSIKGLQTIVSKLPIVANSPVDYHAKEITTLCNNQLITNTPGPMEQALYDFAVTCFAECEKFIVFCYHHQVADTVLEVLKQAAATVCQSQSTSVKTLNCDQSPPELKASANEEEISSKEYEDADESEDKESHATGGVGFQYCSCYEQTAGMKEIEAVRDELCKELMGKIPHFGVVESLKNNNAEGLRLLFNSPFFPMAMVATTKDSEGIDLHRYCRIVVHYELGYRPEALLQANGRVRRIGSWAGRTKKPILYYYPYLKGTRSEALTGEVLRRVERFGHFMGGVPEMSLESLAQDAANHENGIPEPELPDLDFSNGGFCKALHLP